jgi:hypothetical protein
MVVVENGVEGSILWHGNIDPVPWTWGHFRPHLIKTSCRELPCFLNPISLETLCLLWMRMLILERLIFEFCMAIPLLLCFILSNGDSFGFSMVELYNMKNRMLFSLLALFYYRIPYSPFWVNCQIGPTIAIGLVKIDTLRHTNASNVTCSFASTLLYLTHARTWITATKH